ncbi:LysR family transcriptional regulator [Azohydromonas sediminis]|uniref:LysR family transcriptional regulator n=1 Tax=Azohydromonas sediminis TaxID=2259674 RepID=UPI0013C2DE5B|nr:LysR family transcriptional regulator [Azohydromonas sediminis]
MLSSTVLYARLMARARLRHLQLLVAVAEHGSLKRAAEQVGMTQPAATQALADLEALLETPLFERHARGMRVGTAGQAVLPMVRQVLFALQSSMEALAAVASGASGLLRVGAIPAAVHGVLATRLVAFCESHPDLHVDVIEGRPDHLLQDVLAGSLHVALARQPADCPARLQFEPLLADEAVVIAGVGHPLARRRRVTLDELARWRWMRAPHGVGVRDTFDALFDGVATPAVHTVTTTSPGAAVAVLADGATLAMVPRSLAHWYVQHGLVALVDIGRRFELGTIGALALRDGRHGAALSAFIDAMREPPPAS